MKIRSIAYRFWGIVICFLGIVMMRAGNFAALLNHSSTDSLYNRIIASIVHSGTGILGGAFHGLIGFVVMAGGVAMYKKGRRLAAKTAEEMLLEDTRPPVLYLRSFNDDQALAHLQVEDGDSVLVTDEEQIARAMKPIGPMLAIGRPGEKLPELGAARFYVSDSEWQGKILALLKSCALAVLYPASTSGFLWELTQCISNHILGKVIILLPEAADQRELIVAKLNAHLPFPIPVVGKASEGRGISHLIYFSHEGRPSVAALKPPSYWRRSKYQLADGLHLALESVYGNLGMTHPPLRLQKSVIFMWSVLIIGILALIYLVIRIMMELHY